MVPKTKPHDFSCVTGMMGWMYYKRIAFTALAAAVLLAGCGTSSPGPEGSFAQTKSGKSVSGYPAGQPKDAESPALSSSTEQANSNPGPKVPEEKTEKPADK